MTDKEIKDAFDKLGAERDRYWSIIEKCHERLDDLGIIEYQRETEKLYERLCITLDNPR